MARPAPSSTPSRRRSGGGGGWLFLFVVVAAAAAVFFFAGDKVRDVLGIARKPASEGNEPTAPASVEGKVVERLPHEAMGTSAVATKAPEQAKPVEVKPVVDKPTIVAFKDQAKAEGLVAEAEKYYKTFKWQQAKSAADRTIGLSAKPGTLARARDISSGSSEIENLFKNLDDKDELTRNYDTSPSLVQIDSATGPMLVVPVSGDNSKDPIIVDQDPVNYIKTMSRAGKVKALVKGKKDFIYGELPDTLTEVTLVDQTKVKQEKQADFTQKLAALRNSSAARDALAWYDAAKFAYRNRLDDQVTEMLDQALEFDPELVKSVREDKAARLYASMIFHLKNNNKKQADTYMGMIHRKYADTDQGKQAQLYYDGKTQELVAMAMDEDRKRKEDADKRRLARLDKAKQAGDNTKVAAIEKESTEVEVVADNDIPANPDESAAEKAYQEGYKAYSKAVDMPATSERNVVYRQAAKSFGAAVAMYKKLIEKNPANMESLQNKMVEANKLKFGADKYVTAF